MKINHPWLRLGVSLSLCFLLSGISSAFAEVTLPAGTRVAFTVQNDVTTANMKDKAELQGVTTESVTVQGCEVIPKNAPVALQLEKARPAGAVGRGGVLVVSGARVVNGSNSYPLNFSYRAKGKSYRGMTIPLAIVGGLLLPVFGLGIPLVVTAFALHGKEATMSGGTVRYGLTTAPVSVTCGDERYE